LTVAGFHVPVTALSEVVGNAGTVPPAQMARLFPKLKVGIVLGVIVTFRLTVGGITH
jgi:hypothetical protein